MRIVVLSANLGNFDTPVEHVKQDMDVDFHTFTDENFPPIADLPPRFQYRIPKMFGWQMYEGIWSSPNNRPRYYIWLDASMQLTRPDSVRWLIDQLGGNNIAFFKHPWRKTIKEEVDFIEERLKNGDKYITPRYKNGLHKESLLYTGDDDLYASPVFIYRNKDEVHFALSRWWFIQSRFYTCDQVSLTYAMRTNSIQIKTIPGHVFKNDYVKVGSKHR